jgi:hypothetical protein
MTLRCLDQVWHRHRELWDRVEFDGNYLEFAGGRMVGYLICRVNRQNMISGQWEELTSLER